MNKDIHFGTSHNTVIDIKNMSREMAFKDTDEGTRELFKDIESGFSAWIRTGLPCAE